MLTKKELITLLEKFDDDMPIIISDTKSDGSIEWENYRKSATTISNVIKGKFHYDNACNIDLNVIVLMR